MVLLEILIALAIFAIAVPVTIATISETMNYEVRARAAEARAVDQSRLLGAVSLLSANDLSQRGGRRPLGPYVVAISRARDLYFVAVSDTASSLRLATVIYRPGGSP